MNPSGAPTAAPMMVAKLLERPATTAAAGAVLVAVDETVIVVVTEAGVKAESGDVVLLLAGSFCRGMKKRPNSGVKNVGLPSRQQLIDEPGNWQHHVDLTADQPTHRVLRNSVITHTLPAPL